MQEPTHLLRIFCRHSRSSKSLRQRARRGSRAGRTMARSQRKEGSAGSHWGQRNEHVAKQPVVASHLLLTCRSRAALCICQRHKELLLQRPPWLAGGMCGAARPPLSRNAERRAQRYELVCAAGVCAASAAAAANARAVAASDDPTPDLQCPWVASAAGVAE